jgi:SPP1 gp7 family putative phage head morphogenesis protein
MMSQNDYWSTTQGIDQRLELLTTDFTYRIYNSTIQIYGKKNGVDVVQWEGSLDERTCKYCMAKIGRLYKVSWILPYLPHHLRCRCTWRLVTS